MILGIDEVGRGPWAGPLVVGAVVLGGNKIEGLTDSKKLSKNRRRDLDIIIRREAYAYGLGWVSAEEIDNIGLSESLKLATQRAVELIKTPYHEIIIDGKVNFLSSTTKSKYVTTIPKADLLIPSVSAASIIAKVARDEYMAKQDSVFIGYNFASHVGYGTAYHRAAIEKYGVTPLHRLSFAPLAKYRSEDYNIQIEKTKTNLIGKSSKRIGDEAENEVVRYLVKIGHSIIDRNWKTKFCEIDIISIYKETIYFTEVKYRRRLSHGDGISAITPKKLRQMKFAASLYQQNKDISDTNLRLSVASLTGERPIIQTWFALD